MSKAFGYNDRKATLDALRNHAGNRALVLNSFTRPTTLYHNLTFTAEEHAAIEVLRKKSAGILRNVTRCVYLTPSLSTVTVEIDGKPYTRAIRGVVLNIEDSPGVHPIGCNSEDLLPEDLREYLHSWAVKQVRMNIEHAILVSKASNLLDLCTTVGHVHRVWPTLLSMAPSGCRESVNTAKARSPIPEILRKPEWSPDALSFYDTLLAECLCLPRAASPIPAAYFLT